MELCNTSASTARSKCVAELSTFLLGAGVHSYFGCSGSWETWEGLSAPVWFDVCERPLGEPLGPATRRANASCSRRFSHGVTVNVDFSNGHAFIEWADGMVSTTHAASLHPVGTALPSSGPTAVPRTPQPRPESGNPESRVTANLTAKPRPRWARLFLRWASAAARSGSGGLLGGADVAQTSSRRGAAGSELPLHAVGAIVLPVGLSWSALKSRRPSGCRACCCRRRFGSGVVDTECGRWRFVPVCGCVGAVVGGCLRRRLVGLGVGARHGRGDVMVGACSVVGMVAVADGVP